MSCRICSMDTRVVLDLGSMPPANSLVSSTMQRQNNFPLVLEYCESCGSIQLQDCLDSEDLYRNYLYVTPNSAMLRKHYEYLSAYLVSRGYMSSRSRVFEIGSNAGYFLKHIQANVKSILGVDPAVNICEIARSEAVETICDFFDRPLAMRIKADRGQQDLIVARHCLAHNCDPNVVLDGVQELLSDSGFFVVENAYALNTIENNEFDQIYHEHMFYFTIRSMKALLAKHGLKLVDVLMSLVHGGSIVFVANREMSSPAVCDSVEQYQLREQMFLTEDAFHRFATNTSEIRRALKTLVEDLSHSGKSIYTYGATAKGNTLLNYVGLDRRTIPYCVDSTKIKQGKFLPKSNIEVISEESALGSPPDYFLLTAWNYKDEIITKVRTAGNYHSKFIVPIPFVHVV